MFLRSTRWNLIASALFILAMGACGSTGGCGGCSAVQPLPGGTLPAGQTVEGGAQIRVTPQGFNKLTSILPGLLNQQLSNGFCISPGSVGDPTGTLGTGANYCDGHPSLSCPLGCLVNAALQPNGLTTQVTNQQTLNLKIATTIATSIHIDGQVVGIGFACTLGVSSKDLTADLDVALATDPTTGELTVHIGSINAFHLGLAFTGCGVVSDLGNLATDIVDAFAGELLGGLIQPSIDNLIQGFLPRPLGLAGVMNVGNLINGLSPGTQALLETRLVPGGYALLGNNGLSLGVITGINADRDPTTRTPGLSSEPALCVPPLPTPDLGAAPTSLPKTARATYALAPADAFNGIPSDPTTDVAVGISETTLDLAGHHLTTSGALCLGVGTSFVKQLNVSTISLLVPSLGNVISGKSNDPLLLVTRPQRAIDFAIGDNTPASPAITVGIDHLEVDFYAFLYERFVRVFTLDLTVNAGVNLDFASAAGQPVKITPSLVGISPENVKITVLNSEFIKEPPEQLEAVLPSVLNLVTPLLGHLPDITVPPFAGFQLENLQIRHVTTNQDDFLALYASMGPSTLMLSAARNNAFLSSAVAAMTATIPTPQAPSTGQARLVSVTTPAPDRVRGALLHEAGGALPRVTFDVDRQDTAGRELEWAYQLDDGMWRPWRSESPLVIEDQAFAWQGKYTIGLRSRVKGDYHTVSEPIRMPVIIDSVAPRVFADQAAWNGDTYEIPAFDIVSGAALAYAFGKPGSTAPAPASAWTQGGTIELPRDAAKRYVADGKVAVFVKDEAGNTATALVAPFQGQSDDSGCACSTHRTPGAGGLVLIVVVGGWILGRRRAGPRGLLGRIAYLRRRLAYLRRRRSMRRAIVTGALWAGGSVAMSLQPGCDCGSHQAAPTMCEMVSDCGPNFCLRGQLPFCLDNMCVCSDDIPPGRIGPYSHVAVGPDGTVWVSAYAQSYGDLVVAKVTTDGRIADEAWEWVDGVPDGPVTVPDAKIRGGIDAAGPDVGMYTSIAVGLDGIPMVSYFDRETASLKFAQRIDGTWHTHIVDQGTGTLGDSGALVGMYTSLTLRSDDGRPGIAYLAHVKDAMGSRAEVRFASAQSTRPGTAGDWQTWVVDTSALPPDDPSNPSIYPLPEGLGLFIDSTRMPNQAPVVAYYDRASGDLKVAKFNVQAGQFAAARVLDGSNGVDAGWSPSVTVDAKGVVQVAYVGKTTADELKFITDATNALPEVIDNGYRVVGQTVDGLPKPEFHFVGNDASIVVAPGIAGPFVTYQDATTQELLLAHKQPDGTWAHTSIAGGASSDSPWPGGYGFFASAAVAKDQLVMSSWVIDLPAADYRDSNWVEVFHHPLSL